MGPMVKLGRVVIVASLAAFAGIACRDDDVAGPRNAPTRTPSFLISPGTGNECAFEQVRTFDGEGFARGVDATTLCNTFGRIDPWTPIYFNPTVSIAWISGDPDDVMPMQPGPVTFTFHRPILNPVIVTSGEMACFGDLGQVTVHTTSEQTVTVPLKLASPEDCGLDNKTNSYVSDPIITADPVRMIEITPPSVMQWHFDYTITICDPDGSNCHPGRFVGDPYAHIGYAVYFRETPDVVADLHVDCTPSSVVRAGSVACQAQVEPTGTAFQITDWHFFSDAGFGFTRNTDIASTTWGGVVAISGTVSVSATVGGRELTREATITVTPRDWSAKAVTSDILEETNSHLPLQVRDIHDLGDVHQTLVERWDAVTSVIPSGPNQGLAYITDLPFVHMARIHVNRQALSPGSRFWERHPASNIWPGGTCNRSFLTNQLPPMILAHEGAHLEQNSHTWFYKQGVEQAGVGNVLEGSLGILGRISDETRAARSYDIGAAHDAGDAIAPRADVVNPVRLPCTLKFL